MRFYPLLAVLLLNGCMMEAGHYRDKEISFAPDDVLPQSQAKQPVVACNVNGNIVRQNNPACIGKPLRAYQNGPTITMLQPGRAVPVANVEASGLEPAH